MNSLLLSAQNNGVTIALVVFVMLTALLLAFIIMLFAWKRFRDFFFSDGKADKEAKTPDKSDKNKPRKSARKTSGGTDNVHDGIPTVPIDNIGDTPAPIEKKRVKKSKSALDKVPTVIIGNTVAEKTETSASKKSAAKKSSGKETATTTKKSKK